MEFSVVVFNLEFCIYIESISARKALTVPFNHFFTVTRQYGKLSSFLARRNWLYQTQL